MFDMNSLPIPGGIIVAGVTWAVISGFAIGPFVAQRSIEISDWQAICQSGLRRSAVVQAPERQSMPDITCGDIMNIFGNGADSFCNQGGNALFDLLKIDPLAGQKEQLRRREIARLARIAELAPSRCSCAASVVGADRLKWGLYAGSARLFGGPKNLQSDLKQALYSSACSRLERAVK